MTVRIMLENWQTNKPECNIQVVMDRGDKILPNCSVCVYGEDIKINLKKLEKFCFKKLKRIDFDFIVLISAIDYADRKAKRNVIKSGWGRKINIVLPVYEYDLWNDKEVSESLLRSINYLTGDNWNIEFVENKSEFLLSDNPELQLLQDAIYHIIPYSDGLDSYIYGKKLFYEQDNVIQIRLTARNRGVRQNNVIDKNKRIYELAIPVSTRQMDHSENSFRTRSFKFLALSALAANMTDAETISLPENGQGIHGPILMPKGHEYFYVGSHPVFTEKMSIFLEKVFQRRFKFDHPNLWVTKGQTLIDLATIGDMNGWEKTKSCVRDSRHSFHDKGEIQCGICINCMLRRVATSAAGLEQDSELYLWNDLSASDMENSMLPNSDKKFRKNDAEIGHCSVIGLHNFAYFNDMLGAKETLMRSALQLEESGIGPYDDNLEKLNALILTHRREWESFLSSMPESSWVRKTAELVK